MTTHSAEFATYLDAGTLMKASSLNHLTWFRNLQKSHYYISKHHLAGLLNMSFNSVRERPMYLDWHPANRARIAQSYKNHIGHLISSVF